MKRETRKPGVGSKNAAGPGKQEGSPSEAPLLSDDEFGEFFSKGDIGDYEGGVARSEPPPKLVEAQHPEETGYRRVSPEHAARRAFFARLVGGVVAGCVTLLVVATLFIGRKGSQPTVTAERVMAAQPVQPPEEPATLPVAQATPIEVSPPAPERAPTPSVEVSKVTLAPEVPAAPAPKDDVIAKSPAATPEPAAPVTAARSKVTEPVVPVATPKRALKLTARPAAKPLQSATREVKPQASVPAAPKQSIAAFPVE